MAGNGCTTPSTFYPQSTDELYGGSTGRRCVFYYDQPTADYSAAVTLFCRGSTRYLAELIALQPTAIACDWEMEMAAIRRQVPASMAVQGNLNPDLLSGPLELLQKETDALLQAMEGSSGYIFNLGHGILPDARLENVEWLVSRLSVEKS